MMTYPIPALVNCTNVGHSEPGNSRLYLLRPKGPTRLGTLYLLSYGTLRPHSAGVNGSQVVNLAVIAQERLRP